MKVYLRWCIYSPNAYPWQFEIADDATIGNVIEILINQNHEDFAKHWTQHKIKNAEILDYGKDIKLNEITNYNEIFLVFKADVY